ncbi:phage recombination protein Bet [Streptomyces sp. NPDC008222]|uniref:phage recombination protein Bet n=1 Tax=Streptomyces sp. NPDC008222 TaxID=3364820 RepID=UPI0036E0B177
MAYAIEAPAGMMAEGPTSHTQNPVAKTGGALAVRPEQTTWTPEQAAVLRQSGIKDQVTAAELSGFLHLCQRTGLDPFSRQIYLIGRFSKKDGRDVYTPQTGIDGYRVIAQRVTAQTGGTYGYEDTVWCDPSGRWRDVWLADEPPAAAKVTVIRNGHRFSAVATFREYVQTFPDGNPKGLWAKMPAGQIAKCAEALALRKAFPHDLAGVYTAEEMAQADNLEQVQPRVTVVQSTAPAPRRDFLAEAQTAGDADAVRALWQEAKAVGAPTEYLDQLAAIGRAKAEIADAEATLTVHAADDGSDRSIPDNAKEPGSAAQVAAEAGADPLDRLMEQTQRMWENADALGQIREDARIHGQLDRQVEGPLGSWLPLSELLTTRINELKASQGGGEQRAA